ncbi:inosose dehydratase [Cryobacterium melibiosiphilum]|uniref:Inosose dehydratase n=1 Tax=Cryobacterium melibiosiphilum TaxID=995039 RepID=A0A3A5MMC7_9MICO|nr:TIM barrel protein [Cryobacterium melibiosiphilum]RJT88999.1 inosose dehydratase [Cryobacterium melibiosiphilum]
MTAAAQAAAAHETVALAARIAVAPISWGVCEVPGWGWQLSPERVLADMRDLGVTATEFGPEGFLPNDPAEKASTLGAFGLDAVGGFVPIVLHDADVDPVPLIAAELEGFLAAGATRLVLSADTGQLGYDSRPTLTETQWQTLLGNLDRIAQHAAGRGIVASLHPHVGTLVESTADVAQVLTGSSIGLCLDTGHLLIGGTDPVDIAVQHADRISHVHLKDVRMGLAEGVQRGELSYTDAVRRGMYVPLGEGDIDIATIVTSLEATGYTGYYVLEQDTILTGEPTATDAPHLAVRRSIDFILGLPTAPTAPTD